jgi:hypothetical protein
MKFGTVATCVVLSIGWLAGVTSGAPAQKRGQGDVVGAVWEFEARESMRKTAKTIEKGRFRATLDGRLYSPTGNQIGTYSYTNKAKDLVNLKITQGKLKGSSNLVQRGINPPTFQGEWKLEDGSKAHLVLRMIRD